MNKKYDALLAEHEAILQQHQHEVSSLKVNS